MAGTMLSMVYLQVNRTTRYEQVYGRRTFCTTRKLYVSSRWKTFEPMNVKMGMTLWSTASGATRARLASSKQA